MKDNTWTWIDKYGTWFRSGLPRLCTKCGYKGYFKLKEIKVLIPTRYPFMEVCPKCGNQVEITENERIEAHYVPSKTVEKLAKRLKKTTQELINATFKNIIMEFNPKTGNIRFVRKDTGEEISFG